MVITLFLSSSNNGIYFLLSARLYIYISMCWSICIYALVVCAIFWLHSFSWLSCSVLQQMFHLCTCIIHHSLIKPPDSERHYNYDKCFDRRIPPGCAVCVIFSTAQIILAGNWRHTPAFTNGKYYFCLTVSCWLINMSPWFGLVCLSCLGLEQPALLILVSSSKRKC